MPLRKDETKASKPDEVAKAVVESDIELNESELKDVDAGSGEGFYKIDPVIPVKPGNLG